MNIFTFNCWKDENKEKRGCEWPNFLKSIYKILQKVKLYSNDQAKWKYIVPDAYFLDPEKKQTYLQPIIHWLNYMRLDNYHICTAN